MAMMRIDNFVGLSPRTPGRAMGNAAAQQHENLLTTATEFRPLQADKVIGAAPDGAMTLHRMTRDSDGTLRTGDADGWIAEVADKSYVRGQLNDDATERTAVVWNDGTQQPRVIDAKGADRLLGVPPPDSIGVSLNEVEQFTRDDAGVWVDAEFVPHIVAALKGALHRHDLTSRWDAGKPVAGSTSAHGLQNGAPFDLWYAHKRMSNADAEKKGLKGVVGKPVDSSTWGVHIELMPYWGRVKDVGALADALQMIDNPRDGTPVLDAGKAQTLAQKLAALFDPDGPSIAAMRAGMDKAAKDFVAALERDPSKGRGPRPTEPTKPDVPEYYDYEFGDSDRRLKQDIVPVGTHAPTGLTLYEFAYRDVPHRRWRGVMADEVRRVMPEAVRTGADGFDQVNYHMLGLELESADATTS